MLSATQKFGALLFSVGALLLGIGLQNTLVGVRASLEAFPQAVTGVVMSAYFAGFIAGSLLCPMMIKRVGHIRTFSALATICSACAIIYAVFPNPLVWIALRAATGTCIAGLYMVSESWLNGRAANEERGSVLSAYFIVNLAAVAAGQFLLTLSDPGSFELFTLSSVLISLALVPVAMTRTEAPAPVQAPRLDIRKLYRLSPVGVIGTFCAGLANGAFWGMAPVYGVDIGLGTGAIAAFMSVIIVGGMLFQFPLGKLSDRTDRRVVIVGGSLVLLAVAGNFVFLPPSEGWPLLMLGFFLGGGLLTQYALCVAHTNDFAGGEDFVQVASGLLLLFGGGAMIGPFAASLTMALLGPAGLFVFIGTAAGVLVAFALLRMTRRQAPAERHDSEFVAAVPASPYVSELDPRAESEGGPAPQPAQ